MNNYVLGAYALLRQIGCIKEAASLTSTLLPRGAVPKGVAAAEDQLKNLRTSIRPLQNPLEIAEHPVQGYKAVMGKPMYKWPASSKELNYRLHQQTPEAIRTPINYAV